MSRSLLASTSALILFSTIGVGETLAFGPKLPGMGGGGGGTNAVTSKAKTKTVNKILKDVGKSAFRGGKIIASKQKWACDKLAKAQGIVKVQIMQILKKKFLIYGRLYIADLQILFLQNC